jgi:hypothetical protein
MERHTIDPTLGSRLLHQISERIDLPYEEVEQNHRGEFAHQFTINRPLLNGAAFAEMTERFPLAAFDTKQNRTVGRFVRVTLNNGAVCKLLELNSTNPSSDRCYFYTGTPSTLHVFDREREAAKPSDEDLSILEKVLASVE